MRKIMTLPTTLIIVSTSLFLIAERIFPGRKLPNSTGWYLRCLSINLVQLGITLGFGGLWIKWLGEVSFLNFSDLNTPALEGFMGLRGIVWVKFGTPR